MEEWIHFLLFHWHYVDIIFRHASLWAAKPLHPLAPSLLRSSVHLFLDLPQCLLVYRTHSNNLLVSQIIHILYMAYSSISFCFNKVYYIFSFNNIVQLLYIPLSNIGPYTDRSTCLSKICRLLISALERKYIIPKQTKMILVHMPCLVW